MMKRKYLNDLIAWNNDPDKKPLMIWGARQVGKSYLVEELFAKKYYQRKYLKIDCSNEINFVNFVMENSNLSDVLKYIEANYNFKADKDHLLIFDEAQDCIPVIKMMKHFCELRRDIPVIVTGSLVRLKILREAHKRGNYAQNSQFLFPVGKINQIYMYPLTFDEFLFNYNEALYDIVKTHYINKTQMECVQHKKLLDLINDYLFVGGMPEAVDAYLKIKIILMYIR